MILELRSLFCKIGFLMKTLLYLFSLFLFSLSISADDNLGAKIKIQLSPAGSFEISGDISGKATVKDGVYTAKKLKFSTKSLKTGIELRDKHTKEKLGKSILVKEVNGKDGKGTAKIKINGISKKIKFTFKDMGKYVSARFSLSLKDFKFTGINYMGVGVEDKVVVHVNIAKK